MTPPGPSTTYTPNTFERTALRTLGSGQIEYSLKIQPDDKEYEVTLNLRPELKPHNNPWPESEGKELLRFNLQALASETYRAMTRAAKKTGLPAPTRWPRVREYGSQTRRSSFPRDAFTQNAARFLDTLIYHLPYNPQTHDRTILCPAQPRPKPTQSRGSSNTAS